MGSLSINRKFRLTDDQYFREYTPKTNICLHHTVGASALSTIEYWQSNPDRVATAFIVDRDGTIYEVFDSAYWAHHLGLKMARNVFYNQRTIGIELASEGSLRSGVELNRLSNSTRFDEEWLYAFDIDVPPFPHAKKTYRLIDDAEKYFEPGLPWREYYYFDAYDEPQVDATLNLVAHLCDQFDIPKTLVQFPDKLDFDTSILTTDWCGIFTHANVRLDKTDLSPAWDWERLAQFLQ